MFGITGIIKHSLHHVTLAELERDLRQNGEATSYPEMLESARIRGRHGDVVIDEFNGGNRQQRRQSMALARKRVSA